MQPDHTISIRRAQSAADGVALLALVDELAQFEKLEGPADDARQRFLDHGFRCSPPKFEAILAESSTVPCAYAIFFETYSTFMCRPTLYIEDLFVTPAERRRGVGRRIMAWLAREAVRRGCGRMEWSCLDWNAPALGFYAGLDAKPMDEWRGHRLEGEALRRLAGADCPSAAAGPLSATEPMTRGCWDELSE